MNLHDPPSRGGTREIRRSSWIMGGRADSPARVLIVEDDFLQRAWLTEVLEEAGFRVLSATTGEGALEALNKADGSLRAVITDVEMPGSVDGFELAHAIREQWPEIGVVLVSGFTQAAAEIPTNALLLHKPINETVLVRLVERAVEAAAQHMANH